MLKADLNDHDYYVVRAVSLASARFGAVKSVRVHRKPAPFALVEMASREQAFELAAQFGGSIFGPTGLGAFAPFGKTA